MKPVSPLILFSLAFLGVAHPAAAQSVLEQLEQELQQSSGALLQSVVSIEWQNNQSPSSAYAVSGVVVDDQGSVLTTGLPARAAQGEIRAADSRGRELNPKWLGFDPETGLTLLTIEPGRLTPARRAEDVPEVGSWTILIGNPEGMRLSIRYGNISGAGREVQIQGRRHSDLIEFTSSLRPGDSGALLANRRGEMVGIVRSGLTRSDTTNTREARPSGIGFAIPVATASQVAAQLREHGRVQRGFLGIDADEPPLGSEAGAYVLQVHPGTPAAGAGLKAGDLIVAINGAAVESFLDLARAIEKSPPGTSITLQVARADGQVDIDVVLAEKPAPPVLEGVPVLPGFEPPAAPPTGRGVLLGVEVQALTPELRDALDLPDLEGTIVTVVAPGTPAEEAGLRTFDVITDVDDHPIRSPDDLIALIRQKGGGASVNLKIHRGDTSMTVAVTLRDQADFAAPRRPEFPRRFAGPRDRRLVELELRLEALERRVAELEKQLAPPKPEPAPQP
jgi:serine protease Do